jgi:hypothetical protein
MFSWHEPIRSSSRFAKSTSGATFWVVVLLAVAAVIARSRSRRAKAPKPQLADDELGGDVHGFPLRGEGHVLRLGELGVGGPAAQLGVPDGLRVGDGPPCVLGMPAIAALMAAVT